MGVTVRYIMERDFVTLRPWNSIAQAAEAFEKATAKRGHRTFGLVVTDDNGYLMGILSLYDVLNLLRPKYIHIWGEMLDVDITGFFEEACRRAKRMQVGDIMTVDVVSVTQDAHLLMVVDLMIKKHVRRVPVVEDNRVLGIVYASAVFYKLMELFRD
jgi:CBS domain-containing protein